MTKKGSSVPKKGPFDGRLAVYYFSSGVYGQRHWAVEATTLAAAIRAFRVGVMFPHEYSTKRVKTPQLDSVFLSSKRGAVVIVTARPLSDPRGSGIEVDRIPVEDPDAEWSPNLLPEAVRNVGEVESSSTALAPAGRTTGLAATPRRDLANRTADLLRKMKDLERQRYELQDMVREMEGELERRQRQIWMIELFLGSKEQVTVLRRGSPAPVETPITVHQRVLCMDEELVIWYWDQSPEEVGEFDYTSLEDFDQWLLQSERNLDQILPEKKGIVALRVRRNPKSRDWSPERVMEKIHAEEQDRMVYLLVRNGENLYRLWVNVQIWPRFFPRLDEWDPSEEDREWRKHDRKEKEEKARKYVAGLLVVQGLVERSPLFHPLPDQNIDSFNPDHADKYFHLVRNDEVTLALSDGDPLYRITWDGYFEWLQEKVEVGVRVMWLHRPYHDCKLSDRVYMRSVSAWPESDSVYVLDEGGKSRYSAPFSFLYLPDEEIYRREVGLWSSREVVVKRVKRVRFQCYPDELWPVDYLSWRVLHHLLHDRSQREYYSKYLWKIHYLHKWCLKEAEAERPFIDLVLSQVGLDPRDCLDSDRARVERLSRWWKLKTKEHRSVSTDDAKALRMVVRAFKSGKDFEDDPERSLLASMS